LSIGSLQSKEEEERNRNVTMGMNKIDPQEAEKLIKRAWRKISEGIKEKKSAPQIHSHVTATFTITIDLT